MRAARQRPHRPKAPRDRTRCAAIRGRRSAGRTAASCAQIFPRAAGAMSARAVALMPPICRGRISGGGMTCRDIARSHRCRDRARSSRDRPAGTRRCCRRAARAASRCCGPGPDRRAKLAFRQTESVVLENLGADVGGNFALVQHGAPGDVAGILRFELRQELLAHGGAPAVGADEQIAAHARAVGEDGGDAVRVLLDPQQRHAEAIIPEGTDRAARDRAAPTSSWCAWSSSDRFGRCDRGRESYRA